MSPFGGIGFGGVAGSTLDVDGPSLNYDVNLESKTASISGIAIFTASNSAVFPSGAFGNGSFTYEWYINDEKIVDTSVDTSSKYKISSTDNTTTLTVCSVSNEESGDEIYVIASYIPFENEQNAVGGSLISNKVLLYDPISISVSNVSTPWNSRRCGNDLNSYTRPSGNLLNTKWKVVSDSDASTNLLYNWELGGVDLSDGNIKNSTLNVSKNGSAIATISYASVLTGISRSFEVDFSKTSVYDNFLPWGYAYTIKFDRDFVAKIHATGGYGGSSRYRFSSGGRGGASSGTFTFLSGQEYVIQVGQNGESAGLARAFLSEEGSAGTFPGGGISDNGWSGGGGYTGIFIGSVSQSNAILIAAGGGGGSDAPGLGGDGGSVGESGSVSGSGAGGTQSSGGAGSTAGSALQGGSGGAAGGGGGYYGGGSGTLTNDWTDGAGGGGSNYIHSTLITKGSHDRENDFYNQYGRFRIERVEEDLDLNSITVISGSKTPEISLTPYEGGFGGPLRCRVEKNGDPNYKVYSDSVGYEVSNPKNIINVEAFDNNNNMVSKEVELDSHDGFSLDSDIFGPDYNIITFYSTESAFELKLKIYAAAGKDGRENGGEGGTSEISFWVDKDIEYTIIGVSENKAVFLYRGSRLITVVGQGGDGGIISSGGRGGGANIPGEASPGKYGGDGGYKVDSGSLDGSGSWGSIMDGVSLPNLQSHTVESIPNPGKTISCSRGSYWMGKGTDPCGLNSNGEFIRFVTSSGTEIKESSQIIRGFKPGYTIIDTAGKKDGSYAGNGGNGATGGEGGTNTDGGGGGSGYSDNSVTIINSTSGGNDKKTSWVTFMVGTGESAQTVFPNVKQEGDDYVSVTYDIELIYRLYADTPTYDHYCSSDSVPPSGHKLDGSLCRLYTDKAPYTVPIKDDEEPDRYPGVVSKISITCGTPDLDEIGHGNAGTFLSSSTCSSDTYVRPVPLNYMMFGARFDKPNTVPLKVSVGDEVSVLCAHDAPRTVNLNLILDLTGESYSSGIHPDTALANGTSTSIQIGRVSNQSTWNACSVGTWLTVTLPQSGWISGLSARGGQSTDAVGLGQMKINGTLIYPGQNYTTGLGESPIMGYAYPDLQSVLDAGLVEGNVRPIYRLEGKNQYGFYDIMWSIHDDEGYPVYKNTGVKFYAPWNALTIDVLNVPIGPSDNLSFPDIVVKSQPEEFYKDERGRILILCSQGVSDPRTMTKTTGPVMPGDKHHCIDQSRWLQFLKLASSGATQPEIRQPNNIYEDWMVGNPSTSLASVVMRNTDLQINYMWLSDNGWFKSAYPHHQPGRCGTTSPNSPYKYTGNTQGKTKRIYIKWSGEIIWEGDEDQLNNVLTENGGVVIGEYEYKPGILYDESFINWSNDPRNPLSTTNRKLEYPYQYTWSAKDVGCSWAITRTKFSNSDWRLTATLASENPTHLVTASPNNIKKMMNANRLVLRNSLTDWISPMNYKPGWATSYPTQLALAWDETSGTSISGSDYSLLWWVPGNGWGYYGLSSNSFFNSTIYYNKSAMWWLLPPGVPDF